MFYFLNYKILQGGHDDNNLNKQYSFLLMYYLILIYDVNRALLIPFV